MNAYKRFNKAHPIKLCKTGNIRSNFQKLGIFGNLKVLPFQNRHFLLDQMIFGDFISILAKNRDFLSVRYRPAFIGQYSRKYKFQLKPLNIGLLALYETQNSKLNGYTFVLQMFDIFVTFPPLDFRESAEFDKNKD